MSNGQVIQAQVQAVQNLSNTVLISTGNESTNGSCLRVPRNSGQVFSSAIPILNGQGQTFQWNMALPEGSIINTATSCIQFKMKFVFNCKALVAPNDSTGQQVCNIDPNDANEYFLTPGRYTVKDSGLWCEPAFIKADLTFKSYGPPVWVCQFPMNSANILNSSTVQYGNVSHTDDYIFFQRPIIQANLSEEYQAMFSTSFFDNDIDPIMQFIAGIKQGDGITYKSAAQNTAYQVEVYKTFTIGLNMINQLFDIKNKFYTLAFTRQLVQLSLKLQPYSMAKLFFTEDVCDKTKTGITELELFCYVKSSSTLPSDMAEKGAFTQMYHKYAMDTLTLTGGLTSESSPFLSSGHNSSNDVILCLSLPDTNSKDSTYLKQRYTLFNATQIANIMNQKYQEEEFVFFNNLNLERGSATYRYFSENLINPVMMKHEILRSVCALQQYQTSVSQSFNTIMKMMMKYAMVRINLEAYSTESLGDADVVFDGYYSVMQRIMIKTGFKVYNLRADTALNIDATVANNPVQCRIENNLINLYAFQTFDQAVKINPQSGIMQITEDVDRQ